MKWITRERVKVDRAACPWLIYDALYADARETVRQGKPNGDFAP